MSARYFLHCKGLFRAEYHHETLMKMSPQLRGEVANHENSGWVMTIGFFSKVPENEQANLITEISVTLRSCVYCPNDTVVHEGSPNNHLFIVQRGVAVLKVWSRRRWRARRGGGRGAGEGGAPGARGRIGGLGARGVEDGARGIGVARTRVTRVHDTRARARDARVHARGTHARDARCARTRISAPP